MVLKTILIDEEQLNKVRAIFDCPLDPLTQKQLKIEVEQKDFIEINDPIQAESLFKKAAHEILMENGVGRESVLLSEKY